MYKNYYKIRHLITRTLRPENKFTFLFNPRPYVLQYKSCRRQINNMLYVIQGVSKLAIKLKGEVLDPEKLTMLRMEIMEQQFNGGSELK